MGFVNQIIKTYETSSPTTPSASMTQNLQTNAINIANVHSSEDLYAQWTGSPVGTVAFLGSNDGVTFPVALTSIAAGGAAGSLTYDNFGSALQAVQVTYTFSSGTGTLVVGINKK